MTSTDSMSVSLASLVPEDLAVSIYQILDSYLLTTRVSSVDLQLLPEVYYAVTRKDLPIPLPLIEAGILDHLLKISFDRDIPKVGVIRLKDSSPKGIAQLHTEKLESLSKDLQEHQRAETASKMYFRPLAAGKDIPLDMAEELFVQGLHRALTLQPLEVGSCGENPQDLEMILSDLFYKVWSVPLCFPGGGMQLINKFGEKVFRISPEGRGFRPVALPKVDFQEVFEAASV